MRFSYRWKDIDINSCSNDRFQTLEKAAAKGSSRSARNESASLTTLSSFLTWPRGKKRWTETWLLSCSPVASVSRRNSCLQPRSAFFRSGLFRPGFICPRTNSLPHCWRASEARFVISARTVSRTDRGLRSAAVGYGRLTITLPGNRRRSRSTTCALGRATIICSDGRTDESSSRFTTAHARTLSTFLERIDCHCPRVYIIHNMHECMHAHASEVEIRQDSWRADLGLTKVLTGSHSHQIVSKSRPLWMRSQARVRDSRYLNLDDWWASLLEKRRSLLTLSVRSIFEIYICRSYRNPRGFEKFTR